MINAADRTLLEDMLTYARLVLQRMEASEGVPDDVHAESILWNMTLLGEAAAHVSDQLKQGYPEVTFDSARYMRNRLVHGYRTIRFEIVRNTALVDLPPLIVAIERLLTEDSE